jgi:hypothetical protein
LEAARRVNAPPIFVIPKNTFWGYLVKDGNIKDIDSKRLLRWHKDGKN